MNLYFVVEGKRTEKTLYKYWIPYLCPNLYLVSHISELTKENFCIISGGGQPGYFEIIRKSVLDIKSLNNVDYLFICVDSEDLSYNDKWEQIENFLSDRCAAVDCQIIIIIQNHCIETWLMGNRRININNASDPELINYREYYNVNVDDPEDLEPIDHRSIGQFTVRYLKLMLKEKGVSYSKRHVGQVKNKGYFNQLVRRNQKDGHINSFGYFIENMGDIQQR